MPQVWNKIVADDQHNLEKLEESKFIHLAINGVGLWCLHTLRHKCTNYKNGLY